MKYREALFKIKGEIYEHNLKINFPTAHTDVILNYNFVLRKMLPKLLKELELKTAIITDTNVKKIFASQIEHLDVNIFSFPAGENNKTRETKAALEDVLLAHNYGRDSCIIGLGGGVVNDLAGFLASTYCRKIKWIQIPTTLLGMVDASIGGKTGVNTLYGKNMIGSFYFPEIVLVDTKFLETLPEKEQINGIVEILKYGLIKSPQLFYSMRENRDKWNETNSDFIMQTIFQSLSIKAEIVEKDPFEEKGIRMLLNFGHTFGHALETLEEYKIDHGVAVAIGIMMASFISEKMGFLSREDFSLIHETFTIYKVPMQLSKMHSFEDLLATLAIDKKARKSSPRMVLLKKIGQVHPFDGKYCSEVDFEQLENAISWMNQEFVEKKV